MTARNRIRALAGLFELLFERFFVIQRIVSNSKILSKAAGREYWGLNNLDEALISIIGIQGGFFVELGANDGISQSNTKHLELFHGWRGVLIEPYPPNFEKLTKTRSRLSHFENSACVGFDFPGDQMVLTYANLMTTPMGGTSDILDREAHALRGGRFMKEGDKVHKFVANTKTLNSILETAGAPNVIDLLSLDVEGGEIEVLNGVNHNQYRFRWILVEARDEKRITEYLEKYGYALSRRMTSQDYLFEDVSS
jgi:FkbM family methyltransferase